MWLVDGCLLVAHSRAEVRPERTLAVLYLDPLRERIRQNGGRVYYNGPTCPLLIDVKSAAVPTYAALRQLVAQVHRQNRCRRFWATPDKSEVWAELQAAGVNLIGADDLSGLARSLRAAPAE